jgi:hypothetical protein
MSKSQKFIPIGITDFKELIDEDYIYVDKTLLIQELLEKKMKVALIPRPRRFGKTLNLSMLQYFFEKKEQDTSYLFVRHEVIRRVVLRNHPYSRVNLGL